MTLIVAAGAMSESTSTSFLRVRGPDRVHVRATQAVRGDVHRDGDGLAAGAVDAEDGEDVERLPRGDVVDDGAVSNLRDAELVVVVVIGAWERRVQKRHPDGMPLWACWKYCAWVVSSTS